MNFLSYDEQTQQLIEDCKRLSVSGASGAMKKLRELEGIAKKSEDKALLGFVYFYTANWNYDNAKYDLFYRDLKRSIGHLLAGGEYELLARAYNFFATDAQDNDAYDIAYSYYNNALNFIDEEKNAAVAGIIQGNLGGLYYELGDYLQARRCYRRALRLIKKDSNDPFFVRNNTVCHINDGLNSIALGDISAAEKSLSRVKKSYRNIDDAFLGDGRFSYYFFEIRLALVKGEWNLLHQKTDELVKLMAEEEEPYFYMGDTKDFCQMLIAKGHEAVALRILEAIKARVLGSGETQAIRLFVDVMVEYYERTGSDRKLVEALLEQHKYLLQQREDQRKIYIHSIDLVSLVGNLQEEGMSVRHENEILQIQVETDTLTQIPNRYSMERELEAALERARMNEQPIAVVVMDIDDFKSYNDTYGHGAGDLCLKEIGKIMDDFFKDKNIFFARYGGDEFVMIYEGLNAKEVRAAAGKFGTLVKRASLAGKMKREVTVAQGICFGAPGPETKPWDYIAEADMAMYKAKEAWKKNGKRTNGVSMRKLSKKNKQSYEIYR